MSDFALKLHQPGALPDAAPAPRRPTGRWLPLQEAHERSGLNKGWLRRLCLESWQAEGFARQGRTESGQPGWEIDEGADPRFSIDPTTAVVRRPADRSELAAFPPKVRDLVLLKESVVLRLLRARASAGDIGMHASAAMQRVLDQVQMPSGEPPSLQTAYNWLNAYQADDWRGLVDRRSKTPADDGHDVFARFYELVKDWHFRQGEPSIRTCYKLATAQAKAEETRVPSYRTTARYLGAINPGVRDFARLGAKKFDDRHGVFIKRDYRRIVVADPRTGEPVTREFRSDDIWCADHHQCDTLVLHEGKIVRPWLTAWEDQRSRRIVGYRFSAMPPDAARVLLAFRDAVMRNGRGTPGNVYLDNGKDFDAWFFTGYTKRERQLRVEHDPGAFTGLFGLLQIHAMHARPYNAKAKLVERFFKTYADQFSRLTPTYTGNEPGNKPERLATLVKRGQIPSFAEYAAEASRYIDGVYNLAPHTGHAMDGMSPDEAYARNRPVINTTSEEALRLCLMQVTKPKTVRRQMVAHAGFEYGRGNPTIRELNGREVYLFVDPDDVRSIDVYDLKLNYLTTAQCDELAPHAVVSSDQVRGAQRIANESNNATKRAAKRGMRIDVSPIEILAEQAAAAAAARVADLEPPDEPSYRPVRTGFEQQQDVKRAHRRLAVGAENSPVSGLRDLDQDGYGADLGSIFGRRGRPEGDDA